MGWDALALALTRTLARGRAGGGTRTRDERFSSPLPPSLSATLAPRPRRPSSVTDCPLENASCLQRDGNGSDPTPFPRHDGRRGTAAAPRVQRLLLSCMSRMVRQIFVNSYRAGGRARRRCSYERASCHSFVCCVSVLAARVALLIMNAKLMPFKRGTASPRGRKEGRKGAIGEVGDITGKG